MPERHTVLQDKINFLKKKPLAFEVIASHSGIRNLTNLDTLSTRDLSRLQRSVDYYYSIITFPA